MSVFDLDASVARAEERLGRTSARRPRSDRGSQRLHPKIAAALRRLSAGQERIGVSELQRAITPLCRRLERRVPARGTLYELLRTAPTPSYRVADLPAAAQAALYNLTQESVVPGHQLVFYCFNYGDLAAASFAAGLPWLSLYQAASMRGWRERSRGLLAAALEARGIR